MTQITTAYEAFAPEVSPRRLYTKLTLMAAAALTVSGAMIVLSSQQPVEQVGPDVYGRLAVSAELLLPYMISAAVSAITAIAILTVLPMGRAYHKLEVIRLRMQALASGDLSTRLQISTDSPEVRLMAGDLNTTVSALGNQIAQWKIINRQQWDILEHIRHAAARGDTEGVMRYVDRMSKNWERIAEIEQNLVT